jgi:enoyl-CoA hydratase
MPVIAVVNGFALGGGMELALSCDWIVASTKAVFGLPEVTLGLYPGFGGTQRLPRLVGYARAMEMICTGRRLKAEEALAWGIVNQVVAPEELTAVATKIAQQICTSSQYAIRQAKRAIRDGMTGTLDAGMDVERRGFTGLFDHPDRVEGLTAFLEKRKAKFK